MKSQISDKEVDADCDVVLGEYAGWQITPESKMELFMVKNGIAYEQYR